MAFQIPDYRPELAVGPFDVYGAIQRGRNDRMREQQFVQEQEMRRFQLEELMRQRQQETAKRSALQNLAKDIPENERPLFEADPEAYWAYKKQVQQMNAGDLEKLGTGAAYIFDRYRAAGGGAKGVEEIRSVLGGKIELPENPAEAAQVAENWFAAMSPYMADKVGKFYKEGSGGVPDKVTTAMYAVGATDPRDPRVQAFLQKNPGGVNVSVGGSNIQLGDEKGADELQKMLAKDTAAIYQAERGAESSLAKIDRLDSLLDNIETGALAPTAQSVKKVLSGFGIEPEVLGFTDNMGAGEAATALTNEMALELRNPSNGAGMPGAMSDKDREFLTSMTPNLSTTKEGRKMILDLRRRLIKRDKEVGKKMREYLKRTGRKTIDNDFFDELAEWSDKNPIVPRPASEDERKTLKSGDMYVAPDGSLRRIP